MKSYILFFSTLAVLFLAKTTIAQIRPISPDVLKDKNISTESQKTIKTAITDGIFNPSKKDSAKPPVVSNTNPQPIAPKIDLKFASSGEILIQKKITGTDKQSAEIRQLIYIIWQGYVENSKENSFEFNDLARAISYSIFANYRVLNDSEEIPKENIKKLYEQMKEVFSDNADIGKMTSLQKQELAENLVFSAGLSVILAMAAEEEENKEMEKQAKDLAKKNLEELLGVSAFKLKITANGLEEK
jgi:hypothetical protein